MTNLAIEQSKKPSFTDIMTNLAIEQSKANNLEVENLFSQGLPFALANMAINDVETEAPVMETAEVAFLRDITTKQNHFETWGVSFARAAQNYWTAKRN